METTWEKSGAYRGVRMVMALRKLQREFVSEGRENLATAIESYVTEAPFSSFCRLADLLTAANTYDHVTDARVRAVLVSEGPSTADLDEAVTLTRSYWASECILFDLEDDAAVKREAIVGGLEDAGLSDGDKLELLRAYWRN